jgi:formate hydrogenlyase subunit 3/multisubunit Na+/H+ antiporter MnhD subunit
VIPGVYLFIFVPLIAGAALYVLHRLKFISSLMAAAVAGALGVGAFWLPLDRVVELGGRPVALGEPVQILGRQLVMTSVDRMMLAFVFLTTAWLCVMGLRLGSGSLFAPLAMMTAGLLSAALLIRPFVYAALFLTISAVLATILLQSTGQTRGALRYLVLMTFALPAFMLASWLADLYALNPTDAGLPRNMMLALAAGFALLLGVVPFHIWVRSAVEEAAPLATVYVLTACNGVSWFLLFDVLQEYPWLVTQQNILGGLQVLGLLTAIVGSLLAFSSYDFAHVMGYGVVADFGCALLTLGTRTPAGLSAVMLATLARPISLTVLALGLALARERFGSSHFEKLAGKGWNYPWMSAALTVGGFALAGIPPLTGFLGRWTQARLLATTQPLYFVVILGATLGVAAGTLRGMDYLLQPPESEPAGRAREPRLMIVLIVLSVAAVLTLGLFPGISEAALRSLVSSYTFFSAP